MYDYQSVLRQIRYVITKPDSINRRTFVLSCTEAGKHVASNLLAVNVSDAPIRYFPGFDTLRYQYSSMPLEMYGSIFRDLSFTESHCRDVIASNEGPQFRIHSTSVHWIIRFGGNAGIL